jgi:hypothetical protein
MIAPAPGCSLIITGNCPHLEDSLSCEALLFLSLGVVSIPCHKDLITQSCPAWIPRWLQREQFKAKTDTNWGQRCQAFLLLLVNSWAQGRSWWFSAKMSKYLLYNQLKREDLGISHGLTTNDIIKNSKSSVYFLLACFSCLCVC